MPRDNITIIGASAGSGKTFTLCEKYFACLQGGGGDVCSALPRQVLATTFTKKAAAELVQRLRDKLLREDKVKESLCIEDGYIGTVHSVCLALLKDFALESGDSPDMTPLPEEDEDRIFVQATAAVMEKYGKILSRLSHRLSMDANMPFRKPQGLEEWHATVRNLCKLAQSNNLTADELLEQGKRNAQAYLAILPDALSVAEQEKNRRDLHAAVEKALFEMDSNGDGIPATVTVKKLLLGWLHNTDRQWQDWVNMLYGTPGAKSKTLYEPVKKLAATYPQLPDFQNDITTYIETVFTCAAESLKAYAAWKQSYGLLDYNDMEAKALKLLQDPAVATALKGRIAQVFVDEFQDTSPLQLALFLRLAEIAQKSVWVGDIKQSIFAFRGTDPVLMQAVVKSIGHDPSKDLPFSWRSQPSLVNFTNAFFVEAFAAQGIPPESVRLGISGKRKDIGEAVPGLRYWDGGDKGGEDALAQRVAYVLSHCDAPEYQVRDKGSVATRPIKARDIAVLCRSNLDCQKVADALNAHGIRADRAQKGLMSQPEIVFCLAAYRFCVSMDDTLSILEMQRLLQPDMSEWLGEVLRGGGKGLIAFMRKSPVGAVLESLRPEMSALSPSEALRKTASLLDSRRMVARWGNHEHRLANLDMLYALALQYEEACRVRHDSCTHAGYIAWLMDRDDPYQAPGMDNAVRVLTYHKAKGLEWPMVILHSLDSTPRPYTCFGLQMMPPTAAMDLGNPLADRAVHYWPWPGGRKFSLCESLQDRLDAHPDNNIFARQSLEEELRLLYVGMTRARDILVLYVGKGQDAWLRSVLPAPEKWHLPSAEKPWYQLGDETFPVYMEDFSEKATVNGDAAPVAPPTFLIPPQGKKPAYKLRGVTPNGLPEALELVTSYDILSLEGKLVWKGNENPMQVGNAVHAWMCIDMPALLAGEKREAREDWFVKVWHLSPQTTGQLISMSDRLHTALSNLAENSSLGRIIRYCVEWPLYRRIDTQVLSGRVDLLAECERGVILIDHKYEIAKASKELYHETATVYSGQVKAYCDALDDIGHKKIIACLHLPAQGVLLRYETM